MKKYALLFLLLAGTLALNSCSKSGGTANTTMVYTVNGLSDVTVRQYVDTTVAVAVAVAYQSGTQESVTLSVLTDSLPAGVTVTPSTGSGTPSFASTFTFQVNSTVAGTFPIVISATSASTGTKHFRFNLVVTPGNLFTYTVTGLNDITIPQYADTSISIPVTATYGTGVTEAVTIFADSLPTGITFTTGTISGTPTFSGTLNMKVAITTPGTYRVAIHSSSLSSGTKYYSFKVIVTAAATCAPEVAGTYTNVTTSCTPALVPYPTSAIMTTTAMANQIKVNQAAGDVSLLLDLNCTSGVFTLTPSSNVDFTCTGGSGSFTSGQVVATYTLTPNGGGAAYNCASTFSK